MIPVASYDEHPAFAPFARRTSDNDGFVGMDRVSNATINEFVLTGRRHKELIDRNIRRYDEAILADTAIDQRLHNPLRTAVRKAHDKVVEETHARSTLNPEEPGSRAIRSDVEKLYTKGYFDSEMPADLLAQMQDALQDDVRALRERAPTSGGRIVFTEPTNPAANEILHDFCRRFGVFDTLSAYFGRTYDRAGFVVHYSSPHDTWFRVFDDAGLPLARTAQMHFDDSFAHPKAMLYLNDVESTNGAFSLLPRETPWDNLGFELAFGKALVGQLNGLAMSEFEWKLDGNESGFRCPQIRELFVTLPHSLRRTSHVGDHLMDGTALSDDLLRREVSLDGRAGYMPIFAGSHTLHRGGIVTSGERIALQIVFFPPPEPAATTDAAAAPPADVVEAAAEAVAETPQPAPPRAPKSFGRRLREAARVLAGQDAAS